MSLHMPTMADLKKLSPAWWGAVAGAVAAGATLAPNARIIGGLAGGAGMLMLAIGLTPCCAECAGTAATSSTSSKTETAPASLLSRPGALPVGCSDCADSSGIDELS